MIIPTDCKPENEIYFVGASVLSHLSSADSDLVDYLDLYGRVRSTSQVSFDLFRLALDWLFALGLVEDADGMLKKCS